MTNPSRRDPLLLINKYLLNELSDEEAQELLFEVDHHPEIKRLWKKNIMVDLLLAEKYGSDNNPLTSPELNTPERSERNEREDLFNEVLDYVKNAVPVRSEATLSHEDSSGRQGPLKREEIRRKRVLEKRPFWPLGTAMILFFLLIGSALYFESHQKSAVSKKEFSFVAQVAGSINPQWGDGMVPLKMGQKIGPDRISLKRGSLLLELKNKARIILRGPCDFVLNDSFNLFCKEGRIDALIPPEAVGFRVTTPLADVVDRGTEFYLGVEGESVRLDVIQGQVDIHPQQKDPISVVAGQARHLDSLRKWADILPDPTLYLNQKEFHLQWLDFLRQKKEAKDLKERELDRSPGLIGRFVFQERTGDRVRNQAAGGDSKSGARIVRCSQIEGPFMCKDATLLTEKRSRILVNIPGSHRALSFVVTLRVDSLPHLANTILMSRDFFTKSGTISWQFNREGVSQLFVDGTMTKENKKDRKRYSWHSPPCLREGEWNTWTTMVIVFDPDQKKVSQYRDGQETVSYDWKEPFLLEPGEISLGNVPDERASKNNCQLNGAIAEFRVYNRVLTKEEIQNAKSE